MIKSCFFPAWFPHKQDPLSGIFVFNHAKAISDVVEVRVVFVQGVDYLSSDFEEDRYTEDRVEVYSIVFRKQKGLFSKTSNFIRYIYWQHKAYAYLEKELGTVHINHVHVLTRAGIYPYLLSLFRSIPYVVTEHWSRYMPENFSYKGLFRRWLTKIIVSKAKAIMPVSKGLASSMQSCGLTHSNYKIIPNVVRDSFFEISKVEKKPLTHFLNVSSYSEHAKNNFGLLRVFASLSKQHKNIHLTMVGDGPDLKASKAYAKELGLDKASIEFLGAKVGSELEANFKCHQNFVLFSNYETQAVVLMEALASGLSIISTNVGGIKEYLNDSNSILVEAKNETMLKLAILKLIEEKIQFLPEKQRKHALQFSTSEVGQQIINEYQKALG